MPSPKAAVERLLSVSPIRALARRAVRSSRLVLAYHNVVPDGEPVGADRSLHIPLSAFERHLDELAMTHRVVPLSDVLGAADGLPEGPCVAITFDDAYLGAVRFGVAALAQRGLPATIFVSPGLLGGRTFWWDAFSFADQAAASDFRDRALRDGAGMDEEVRALAAEAGLAPVNAPEFAVSAGEGDVDAALERHPGLSVGAHSWTHPNLACIGATRLEEELHRPLLWLASRTEGRTLRVMSYPYGSYDARVAKAASRTGYDAAFASTAGWIGATVANRYGVPRLNVPAGISRAGFRLRIDGVLVR